MRVSHLPVALERCGFFGAFLLLTSRRRLRRFLPATSILHVKHLKFPFHFRRVSTDKYVIAEVLLADQYACLKGLTDVRTIIDAGANIGTASVVLLNEYPRAKVLALEPDPQNFDVLARNLRYYDNRAIALRRALWPRSERLSVDRGHFRDGGDWSTQVTASTIPDTPSVDGLTLEELIAMSAAPVIDILKIDVEGAERYILDDSFTRCLEHVRVIAIELHDAECRRLFNEAIAGRPGRLSQHGEVTVWQAE